MDWFAKQVLNWSQRHGRTDFPWQTDKTPYRVWVSEIMLQQTRASAAKSHFNRFINEFPDVEKLAGATEDEVLSSWLGLGYYRRAQRLREAAIQIVERFGGELPKTVSELCSLPGIGRSTAGAILSCAFSIPAPILDANVRRVLARFHAVNGPRESKISDSKLWTLAESHTPLVNPGDYAQAIMDFGSKQCTQSNPQCDECPLHKRCMACQLGSVHLYPQSRKSLEIVQISKRPLVILDSEGSCLLRRLGDRSTYARLWESPDIPPSAEAGRVLKQLNLPINEATICKGDRIDPYTISNQRVTEDVTVARFSLLAKDIGTPAGTSWYKNQVQTPLGISVKTQKRIDLARKLSFQS